MSQHNFQMMKYLDKEHFRVLTAIELGMRDHEIVSLPLIHSISGAKHYNINGAISYMIKEKLIQSKRKRQYDGFKLTYLGYDYLALHTLTKKQIISSIGARIGCGKEADIYMVDNGSPDSQMVVKLHHLGLSSFKTLKNNRDFHKDRSHYSWIYISRLSCQAEFEFMKILSAKGLNLPKPHGWNRNAIVMDFIEGYLLTKLKPIDLGNVDMQDLFGQCIEFLKKLATFGLIHGDLNEFNILVRNNKEIVIIDFPQMISLYSPQAKTYFERDIEGITSFFSKFDVKMDNLPKFEDIVCVERLDVISKASGFNKSTYLVNETLKLHNMPEDFAADRKNEMNDEILAMFDEKCTMSNTNPENNENLNELSNDDCGPVNELNDGYDEEWVSKRVKQEMRKKQLRQTQSNTKNIRVNHIKKRARMQRSKA